MPVNLSRVNSYGGPVMQQKYPNSSSSSNEMNKNNNFVPQKTQSHTQQSMQNSYARPNEHFIPSQNKNANLANGGNQLGAMPLAFPPTFSHQLATLSLDQQKYLLEQQRALVLALAATEQMAQYQMGQQQQGFFPKQMYTPQLNEQQNSAQNQSSQQLNGNESKGQLAAPKFGSVIKSNSQPLPAGFQAKESFVPPAFFATQKSFNPQPEHDTPSSNNNTSNLQSFNGNRHFTSAKPNFLGKQFQQQNGFQSYENVNLANANHDSYPQNSSGSPFVAQANGGNASPFAFPNMNMAEIQKLQMQLQNSPINGEFNGLLENAMNDPASFSQLAMNNEKLRYA